MTSSVKHLLRPALINLNLVALLGVILRYKIAFSLPFIDQKHLLHSHSHFSFSGWISQALMVIMVAQLYQMGKQSAYRKYSRYLILNLVCAYGMLVSFAIQGYGLFSITFSTLSIILSFAFGLKYWKDLNRYATTGTYKNWLKAAIAFNLISSLGAFSLSVMMAMHVIHQNGYLASIYFFLHFQYNGWFFFACMGFICRYFSNLGIPSNAFQGVFRMFAIACIPAYFLSALWLPIPGWIYALVVLAAIVQMAGWVKFLSIIYRYRLILRTKMKGFEKILLGIPALTLSIKLMLQLGSVYPPLSELAFGFRPIVIGYLHLVLLGVITLFLIIYMVVSKYIVFSNTMKTGLIILIGGIFFNELLLMLQGINALRYEALPYSGEALLFAALIMFGGVLVINYSQFKKDRVRVP